MSTAGPAGRPIAPVTGVASVGAMPHPPPSRRLAAVAAAGLLLAACGGDGPGVASAPPSADTPPATEACTAVDFPPLQFGSHLLGDNEPPVPYSSSPPTSGWHTSGAVPEGIFVEDPLSEPAQVSVLEAGGVVVTYADLPDADVRALVEAAEGRHAGVVVVTPYDGLAAGEVAFTSWGAVQRCEGLDEVALDAYVAAYGSPISQHS